MNEQHVDMMKLEMQDVLENNILPFWLEKMQDNENGGFYGRIDGEEGAAGSCHKGERLPGRPLYRPRIRRCVLERGLQG